MFNKLSSMETCHYLVLINNSKQMPLEMRILVSLRVKVFSVDFWIRKCKVALIKIELDFNLKHLNLHFKVDIL
jgi:hypothetical protein